MAAGGAAFTTLAEDLVSHGYVVVGFDAPYRSRFVVLPDNRVVLRYPGNDPENQAAVEANHVINKLLPLWISDTIFVVNKLEQLNEACSGKFTDRLDMQHRGMFGHSFGGAQTLQFCADDARCKAGIDIDGAPYGSEVLHGLKQAFPVPTQRPQRRDVRSRQPRDHAALHSIYDRLPNGRLFVNVRGAHHFSFSDQALLKSQLLMKVTAHLSGELAYLRISGSDPNPRFIEVRWVSMRMAV